MPIYGPPQVTLSRWDLIPLINGANYSSDAPASYFVNATMLPAALAFASVNFVISLNASVPSATSANSSGTEAFSYSRGFSIFTRNGYGANSSQISYLTGGSVGLTAGMTYSSGSQTYNVSWVTNSTGGTTSFSTTSGAGNWSSYATGPKVLAIPLVTTLSAGEYFFFHGFSTTTATTGSNVTLLSVSWQRHALPAITYGGLDSSVTSTGAGVAPAGFASAITTNNTMAASVITARGDAFPVYFSNI